MIRMPAIAEPGSSLRSRVRFQELPAESSDAGADKGSSEGNEDREVVSAKGFELKEDPSFWKDHNVQVVIRIRPLNSVEISLQGQNLCVKQDNYQTVTWVGHPESRFTFDLVADEHVSQEKLFKVAGVPMVENCVSGYNSCMFAYGQTGSGKTHTMLGDIEGGTRRHSVNCGMTPRVFEYLFTRIQKEKEIRRDEKLRFTCKCSFLEIYNEQILDLLEPSSVNLQLREDAKKGIHVENLLEIEVSSARDVMQQLIQGAANRKVAATNMNRASSRSHSVFTCVIESKWESQGITHHRFARLNLVDLAGSERQKSSGAEGDRLKEATNINKSLSTLGLVIMNLVGISNKKSLHVPYRDSKLTFLLQDSLGGNSKTIIIANISPSNCCALETLSTLKFAQRAKFIRNNAFVNEDASGDILAMRLQIQQLKKEVSRLRGGAESSENDGLNIFIAGSPATFRWDDGVQGSFNSPLTFDKRLSQRKEYEAALMAAFRRDRDKEVALKALGAVKEAAEQLATQRIEEVRSLKMRLRFREEGIKRLEAIASGKLSAESHLLQEREEILKEIEVLRNQADRNPEITRFAMENLQLKEELRRLQSFVEEGEREMLNEQIIVLQDKLLEALDWKLMHEKDSEVVQDLSLSLESSANDENEFLRLQAIQNEREVETLRKNLTFCLETKEKLERRVDDLVSQLEEQRNSNKETQHHLRSDSSDNQMKLKTMVDAIAAASQREAEAHQTAIILSKENEELRMKLRVMFDDNNKLIELYKGTVTEIPAIPALRLEINEDHDMQLSSGPENYYSEMKDAADTENLEQQLQEMHEENDKLMGLYETAMKERDEFKRMLSSYEHHSNIEEISCPEKLVEVDEEEMHEENDKLMGLYETAMKERDEFKRMLSSYEHHSNVEEISCPEKLVEVDEEEISCRENLCLVRAMLDQVQDKLVASGEVCNKLGLIEKAHQLSEAIDHDARLKQQEITTLRLALSKTHERRTTVESKIKALKVALQSFSSKTDYWDEREARARARVDKSSRFLDQNKEELQRLQNLKNETNDAYTKARESEAELKNKIGSQKLKIQGSEDRKKETERALFAIDNLDRSEFLNFGRASELLKSEEERTKITAELKNLRERLTTVQMEIETSTKTSEAVDAKIETLEAAVFLGSSSLQEVEVGLEKIVEEKRMLSAMRDDGWIEIGDLLVEYQGRVFESDLKEEEIQFREEELEIDFKKLEELQAERKVAIEKLNLLMEVETLGNSSFFVSTKLEEEIGGVCRSLAEAKSLLIGANER